MNIAGQIKVAVIGCGYWGPNLVRNFSALEVSEVKTVCDLQEDRLYKMKSQFPMLSITQDYKEVLKDPEIKAVAIATSISTHFQLALEALNAGKDVLIEKPMTTTVKEGETLIRCAREKKRILMVDHTFLYTSAIRKMKEIIDSGSLGEILYFDSVRVNLGLFQHDVNVIWDLAPHDLSIMDYILDKKAKSLMAFGSPHLNHEMESIAYLHLQFENNLLAHFHINWLAPVKIRKIMIGGKDKMLIFDDMESDEKIKIYDKGVTIKRNDKDDIYNTLVQYRMGDMYSPCLNTTEALKVECEHFIDCVIHRKRPQTDGEAGLRVVRLLEAADMSLKDGLPASL